MNALKLSIQKMTEGGYTVFKTEYHVHGRSHDLFGFADALALKRDERVIVQATSRSNVPARVKKIVEHENLAIVREAGFRILVQGWYWNAKNNAWNCREVDLS